MDLPGWRAPALLIAAALIFGLFGSASASAAKKPPVKVSTGSYHTCAVDQQKHVQCWGYDDYGETAPPTGKFKSVGAGYYSTCGLKTNQRIACWGLDDSGEASPPGGKFKSLAEGIENACAVRVNGRVECWGDDDDGSASPPNGKFLSVSVGEYSGCGVKEARVLGQGRRRRSVSSSGEVQIGGRRPLPLMWRDRRRSGHLLG